MDGLLLCMRVPAWRPVVTAAKGVLSLSKLGGTVTRLPDTFYADTANKVSTAYRRVQQLLYYLSLCSYSPLFAYRLCTFIYIISLNAALAMGRSRVRHII